MNMMHKLLKTTKHLIEIENNLCDVKIITCDRNFGVDDLHRSQLTVIDQLLSSCKEYMDEILQRGEYGIKER